MKGITNVKSMLDQEYVEILGDGVKTVGAILDQLYSMIDLSKVSPNAVLISNSSGVHHIGRMPISADGYRIELDSVTFTGSNQVEVEKYNLKSSGSQAGYLVANGSYTAFQNNTSTNGYSYRFYY